MKKIAILLSIILLIAACGKKEVSKNTTSLDFETMMGKNTERWSYVQTPEDFQNLAFFKKIYEKNIGLLNSKSETPHIPKVLHYIWIGPKPFPLESVENVKTWIANNPEWTVKFWTDRADRPLPHPKMQLCLIQESSFSKLFDCYNKSDNYGEKSDVLRYEILYKEGGVYVDHDVTCFRSFSPLNDAYDLYIGMEMPYKTALSSCVNPTNNIVAARAGHPVLLRCMDWLSEKWDILEASYPGKDRESIINRVSHRTFYALPMAFKEVADQDGRHDIALPAFYFNAPDDKLAIFSRHQYQGTWFDNESAFEKLVRERLMKISKKTNNILLFFGAMSVINIFGFALLFMKYRKISQKT
jgi:hypothetical protein